MPCVAHRDSSQIVYQIKGHGGRVNVGSEEHHTLQGKHCDAVDIAAIGPKCEHTLALMANGHGRSRTCKRMNLHDVVGSAIAQKSLHLQENIRPVEPAGKAGPVEAIEIHGVAMAPNPRGNC
jgi:hypothetical protein